MFNACVDRSSTEWASTEPELAKVALNSLLALINNV